MWFGNHVVASYYSRTSVQATLQFEIKDNSDSKNLLESIEPCFPRTSVQETLQFGIKDNSDSKNLLESIEPCFHVSLTEEKWMLVNKRVAINP
jgi:hypothetical protein